MGEVSPGFSEREGADKGLQLPLSAAPDWGSVQGGAGGQGAVTHCVEVG